MLPLLKMKKNRIHPTALIDQSVHLGDGNTIGPYTVIHGDVIIGNDNWIGPHVVIGTPAQMRGGDHFSSWKHEFHNLGIRIGSNNIIREFSTIHSGTVGDTTVGDDCYLMTQSHVPHDAQIADRVTLSNSVQLGGHTIIQVGANVGLGTVVHQRSLIGVGAMIGMGSVVTKPILPYSVAFGSPANMRGGNKIGMHRIGFSSQLITQIDKALCDTDIKQLEHLIPREMQQFLAAAEFLER